VPTSTALALPIVLCIGTDGHKALELGLPKVGCDYSSVLHHRQASKLDERAGCTDFDLIQFTQPRSKPSLATSFPPAPDTALSLDRTTADYQSLWDSGPRGPLDLIAPYLTQLRTVVLRI
jgi:hypothetical protein